MKEKLIYTKCIPLLGLLLFSCSGASEVLTNQVRTNSTSEMGILNVPNQITAPQSFRAIQLYEKGSERNPPILSLNGKNKLILEFDELASISGQFRLTFQHYDQNWQPSNIPDDWFLDGFNEIIISGGDINSLYKPSYIHYEVEFPKSDLSFITSGNFMVHIHDFATNRKLFSLPFFISENEGKISSNIETVFNAGRNGSAIDQYFGEFEYPEFVEFPQFELGFEIVQNRFWGSSVKTETFSTVNDGFIHFHTPRSNAFSSDFDFISLDLTELAINNFEIEDWQPEFIPPRVILRPDFVNFLADPPQRYFPGFGLPEDSRNARYTEVTFQLDASPVSDRNADIYVSGDFNQWQISPQNKLSYNPESGNYISRELIKQGNYRYKYFYSDSENTLPVNDSITKRAQEYISFIYYTDPVKNYQRLLVSDRVYSE